MPELQVDPQVLAATARELDAERRGVEVATSAAGPALRAVATALPGSQTAEAADRAGAAVAAAVGALAAELATLTAALAAAAEEYLAVECGAAAGLERAGRRPA
jgi:hypothetical protein